MNEETNIVVTEEKQNRFKSPVFWSTLIGNVAGLMTALGFWSWVGISESQGLQIAGAAVAIISALVGNYNNPTDKVDW